MDQSLFIMWVHKRKFLRRAKLFPFKPTVMSWKKFNAQ